MSLNKGSPLFSNLLGLLSRLGSWHAGCSSHRQFAAATSFPPQGPARQCHNLQVPHLRRSSSQGRLLIVSVHAKIGPGSKEDTFPASNLSDLQPAFNANKQIHLMFFLLTSSCLSIPCRLPFLGSIHAHQTPPSNLREHYPFYTGYQDLNIPS